MGLEERFEDSKRFLQSLGFDVVSHSRRTLFDHLVSTGNLLREWDCPEDVCLAGMFHAVYGTESFRYQNGLLPSRGPVQAAIGPVAERIAWLFGISTGKSLWHQFTLLGDLGNEESHRVLTHRLTGEELACTESELLALADITLANALDQAQHLPKRYDTAKLASFEFLLPYVARGGVEAFQRARECALKQG